LQREDATQCGVVDELHDEGCLNENESDGDGFCVSRKNIERRDDQLRKMSKNLSIAPKSPVSGRI